MKSVLFLFCVVTVSQAFLFWGRSGRQQAERDRDSICENRAKSGDCGFYTCFDVRHPCTRHNWALSYGWRYCTRFNQEYRRFTNEAKRWINGTRLCIMEELLKFYNQEYVNCEDLEHDMKSAHARCEELHGVCNADMIADNRDVLMDVYKISRRGAVRFFHYLKQCGGTELTDFVSWLGEQRGTIDTAFNQFTDLVSEHGGSIADKLGDLFD